MARSSRYAGRGRRDANHAELASVYVAAGWHVADTSSVGGNIGDTFVLDRHGLIHAREFKTAKGKVTPEQQAWLDQWGGKVIRSVEDALEDIRETQ